MVRNDNIEILFLEKEELEISKALPSFISKEKIVKLNKENLAKSFSELFDDIEDIFHKIKFNSDLIELDQVKISVQISAEAGVHWIGMASVGLTNSIDLCFKIKNK